MRTSRTLLTLGLAALSLGVLAQAPPRPPVGGPKPMGPMLMDPKVQRELHLSKAQIARLHALLPAPPKPGKKPPLPPKPPIPSKPGGKPPLPPKPDAMEAKIEAILTPEQRAQLRKMRPAPPTSLKGLPRVPKP